MDASSSSRPTERELFFEALERPDPEARAAFLDGACRHDPSLRQRVESLLAHHLGGDSFMAGPAAMELAVCHRCGQPLTTGSPRGLCPGCLLLAGLPAESSSGAGEARSAEAMAAAIPFAASLTERSGDNIGRYKLLERIGEGGMGVVWMAEQQEPVRRKVALKSIKLGMDTRDVIARFEAERQALALMDHPNIAKVFDGGATGKESSADFRSAVSPTSSRQSVRHSEPAEPSSGAGQGDAPQAGSAAIQQTGSPRYELGSAPLPSDGRGGRGEGIPAGRPYFVMELVRGLPITKYCDEVKMPIRQRLELFALVCRAVQHAHQKGVIHRDLKPSNILVTEQDGRAVPKVIDFGIAKATAGRLTDKTLFTGFAQLIGTPAYMSPEQAGLGSLDVDTRSDTYSLGVVLYELLTGRPPFDTRELLKQGYEAVLRTIREVDPPRSSTRLTQDLVAADVSRRKLAGGGQGEISADSRRRLQEVRGDLDWIVMKCLEKDRTRRYETATGLAADLERYLHDEPVAARPPSTGYRMQKFVRKHRTGVGVAAGFFVLLVAAAIASSSLALWANRERKSALLAQQASSVHAKLAQDSEADAKAVLKFFEDKVLAAARPEGEDGGLGRTVTLQAAVAKAERELGQVFTNRPLVEASIRAVIGRTFHSLGDYDNALLQNQRSLDLRLSRLAPDYPDLIESMNQVGQDLAALDRFTNAINIQERALELQRRSPVIDARRLSLQNNLAAAYLKGGQRSNALALLKSTVESSRAILGTNDEHTLTHMNNLAEVYRALGRTDEALPLLEETLRRRQELLPPGHPDTIISMQNLGVAYQKCRRWSDAISLFRQTLALSQERLGPDHVSTLDAMNNLGLVYENLGQMSNALPLLEKSLELAARKFGTNHIRTMRSLNNLAHAYANTSRIDEAIPLYEQALTASAVIRPVHHPGHLELMNNVSGAYRKAGRNREALELLKECYTLQRQQLGPDHLETLRTGNNLAVMYRSTGQASNSLRLSEEVLRLASANPQPDYPLALWMRNLAICYQDLARMSNALPLFRQAFNLCQTNLPPNHADTLRALFDLAQACQLAAEFPEAEERWRDLLIRQRTLLPAAEDATLADTQMRLAESLLYQAKFSDAADLLREVLPTLETRQPTPSALFTAQSLLGWALLGQRRYTEAEPFLLQAHEGLRRRESERPSRSRARLLADNAGRLARLYEGLGKPEKAAVWREKAR